jgi:hypothetical protein
VWPLRPGVGQPRDGAGRTRHCQAHQRLARSFSNFVKRYQTFPGKVERQTDKPWMENVVEKNINLFDLIALFRQPEGAG